MMWSKHSRRMEPISRSTYGFCHGERGALITSSIPRPFVMATQSPLYRPLLAGVFGHLKVQHTTPSIGQHHEHKQNPEGRCRHHKKADGGNWLLGFGQEVSQIWGG